VVLGAGGAVGQAAIGAARAQGAGRVVAVCRPGDSATRAAAQGPDAVVEIGDPDPTLLAEALLEVLPHRADVVVDPVFGWVAEAAVRAMAPGGRLVNLGGSAAEHAPLDSSTIRSRSLRVLGYTNNELTREQKAAAMAAVARHAAAGELSVAHEVVPLEDATDAWVRQAEGRTIGQRLVLVPSPR
jgi:NADPH:quinone reductase-like Zn-dependent oxidoreductase